MSHGAVLAWVVVDADKTFLISHIGLGGQYSK